MVHFITVSWLSTGYDSVARTHAPQHGWCDCISTCTSSCYHHLV